MSLTDLRKIIEWNHWWLKQPFIYVFISAAAWILQIKCKILKIFNRIVIWVLILISLSCFRWKVLSFQNVCSYFLIFLFSLNVAGINFAISTFWVLCSNFIINYFVLFRLQKPFFCPWKDRNNEIAKSWIFLCRKTKLMSFQKKFAVGNIESK